MDQRLPFQRSASVIPLPETGLSNQPTAVHLLGEVHETPSSSLPLALAPGIGWMLQPVATLALVSRPKMATLRDAIGVSATGGRSPLAEYHREAADLFARMRLQIKVRTVVTLFHLEVEIHTPGAG